MLAAYLGAFAAVMIACLVYAKVVIVPVLEKYA